MTANKPALMGAMVARACARAIWGVALLGAVGTTHAQTATSTLTRTSSFEYDAQGMLVTEVIEPDTPDLCRQTTYTYDAHGNRSAGSNAACAGASGYAISSAGQPRTASSTFNAQNVTVDGVGFSNPAGLFATNQSNVLGHTESTEIDARTGKPLRLEGPNGGVTTWSYDSFGRKTRENRADGTYTVWEYRLCQVPGQAVDAACATPVSHGGFTHTLDWYVREVPYGTDGVPLAAAKYQFHDSLGRVVRTRSDAFFHRDPAFRHPVVQDTVYNGLGQKVYQSIPYLTQGGNPHWTSYENDAIGRVVREVSPNGNGGFAEMRTVYSGLMVTVTNALNQTKTTYKNVAGQIERVVDHLGGEVLYAYDALGQLVQTNAAGSITRMTYDLRGRKTSMQDPAMGRWDYAYNVFDELVWQQDSLGQVSTMAYDRLGRMVQRTEPDLVSHWYYDQRANGSSCGAGIGKLCEATASNGYRRLHTYDAMGRPLSTSNVLDNSAQPATVSQTYDPITGRLREQVWPTGYRAVYEYTTAGSDWTAGHLLRVRGMDAGVQNASWQALDMDPQGRLTAYVNGNNVLTAKTYDAPTGRITRIQSTLNGEATGEVFDHTYGYDALGNLTARSDANTGVSETFSYDALNRLSLSSSMSAAFSTGTEHTQVLYDAAGNIRYKSDVGYYHYDAQRPNRLTAITLGSDNWAGAMGSVVHANRGSKALAYAFDDYLGGVRSIDQAGGGTLPVGNGNLMYTVSQDQAGGAHTVRWEEYTSFNKIREMRFGQLTDPQNPTNAVADRTVSFVYGPEHQRLRQTITLTSNAPSNMAAGTTWYMNGPDSQGLSYEKEIKADGTIEHKHYVGAGKMQFALHVQREGALNGRAPRAVSYFHHDHLGSLATITNEGGAVTERLAFDPWGKRRNLDGQRDANDTLTSSVTKRGYTMHEHMDEMGVINMNGRVYDPLIGRFLSADPHIQSPSNLQSFNRYAYVLNNPLAYTDPSGYFFKKLFRAIVAIVVVAVIIYFAPAVVSALTQTTVTSVAAMSTGAKIAVGAIAGGVGSAINAGTGKAFWRGAISGALFAAAGAVTAGENVSQLAKLSAHAGAGCVSAAASGGNCGRGAASAIVGKFVTINTEGLGGDGLMGDIAQGASATVSGGLASMAGGGKFSDGALTAAFGYLFNQRFNKIPKPGQLCGPEMSCGGGVGGGGGVSGGGGRSGALNDAKRDLGIPRSKHPDEITRQPMTDINGKNVLGTDHKPIMTREYTYTRPDGSRVIIQDHSAGHRWGQGGRGDQGPHFNVRPPENPRTGHVPGAKEHYSY
jgi:RHS repeat-associated protein